MHMQGISNTEVASIIGCTPQTVSNTIRSPYFQEAKQKVFSDTVDEITQNIGGRFSPLSIAKANAAQAMQINVEMMLHSKREESRLRACHDILDRVMGKPTQRIAIEDLEDSILERMSESETELYVTQGVVPDWARDAGLSGKSATIQ